MDELLQSHRPRWLVYLTWLVFVVGLGGLLATAFEVSLYQRSVTLTLMAALGGVAILMFSFLPRYRANYDASDRWVTFPFLVIATTGLSAFTYQQASVPADESAINTPTPTPVQQEQATVIPSGPTPAPRGEIEVGSYTQANDICVEAGDRLSIQAEGLMKVGDWVGDGGYVGPDGTERGAFGVALGDDFDLVNPISHAALMCRLIGESEWRKCGSRSDFEAPLSGCLEFEINDNDPGNNSGAFTVYVEIMK